MDSSSSTDAGLHATALDGGDPQSGQRRTGNDRRGRTELLRAARDRHGVSANASKTQPAKLLARGEHERDGTGDPIRELRSNYLSCGDITSRENAGRQCTG